MDNEPVVVTGIGAIACNGYDTDSFWKSIISGKEGYTQDIDKEDNFPFKVYGKVNEFDPHKYLNEEEIEKLDRSAQLGLSAAKMAIDDSGIDINKLNKKRVAVVMGTTTGANLSIEENHFDYYWFNDEKDKIKDNLKRYYHSNIPNSISKKYGFQGPSYLEATACASGNHTIGEGKDLIQLGKVDVTICGGAESISLMSFLGFNSLRTLAKNKCAPYDKNREGIIIGEGAGILVLESYSHAVKRGAKIYATIPGWAINCDAFNITSPIISGERCAELINQCFKSSGINKEEIDYISLHGTGTDKNDLTEVNGIKKAFGSCSKKIAISSIKSMIGHTFGAAGALEGIVSVLSIKNQQVPPNINLEQPDDGFDLNFITKTFQKMKVNKVLSLSFGFGGCNVATIFSKN